MLGFWKSVFDLHSAKDKKAAFNRKHIVGYCIGALLVAFFGIALVTVIIQGPIYDVIGVEKTDRDIYASNGVDLACSYQEDSRLGIVRGRWCRLAVGNNAIKQDKAFFTEDTPFFPCSCYWLQ